MEKIALFQGDFEEDDLTEDMLGAASVLIREWAQSSLGIHFSSLSALARHLVDNLFVDNQSLSAVCILCASENSSKSSINKGMHFFSSNSKRLLLNVLNIISPFCRHDWFNFHTVGR